MTVSAEGATVAAGEQPEAVSLGAPQPLLEIKHATKVYGGGLLEGAGRTIALRDFSLTIAEKPATITTIAGESGSGKTTLANAILGFLNLTSGQIVYRGMDVARLSGTRLVDYRRQVQAIFQDPYEVYNPFYRIRHVFDLVIARFRLARTRREADKMIDGALRVVGLNAAEVLAKYPHQLSGGQRQRIMVARAFLLRPRLIVADEPVSMVDASLRAMILEIMLRMRDEFGISFVYITHDLSTAYQISDQTCILYRGSIAEKGPTTSVIEHPRHPYVQLLLGSIPVPDPAQRWQTDVRIPSEDEDGLAALDGCPFYGRCDSRMDRCRETPPPLYQLGVEGHQCACYLCEQSEKGGGATTDAYPLSTGHRGPQGAGGSDKARV
jgi:peptide/nickel transport system ATP-binding protein